MIEQYRAGLLAVLGAVSVSVVGCGEAGGPNGAEVPLYALTAPPGEPLPGLSEAEQVLFRAGEALFGRPFGPGEGLGPLFNEDRCSACHDLPVNGGAGAERVQKATRVDASGRCDLLAHAGGDNIQRQATPLLQAAGIEREPLPRGDSVVVAEIAAPPLFALGLVEAVPDETLLAWADPEDADGDGISGRGARAADGRLARFGRKATHATLRGFVVEALATEMGLTTPGRPDEEGIAGAALPPGVDPAPDPEVGEKALRALVAYTRLLAPLPRDLPAAPDDRAKVARGRALFAGIGCGQCHRASLTTGPSDVAALDRKTFPVYSDFLLHDLGPRMATICAADASRSEFRTAPLLGLRHRTFFLHDGRAEGPDGAIRAHGGEAAPVRRRYEALAREAREALLRFLNSL